MTKSRLMQCIERKARDKAEIICMAAERAIASNRALSKMIGNQLAEGFPATIRYEIAEELIDEDISSRVAEIALFDELSKTLQEIRDERSKRSA